MIQILSSALFQWFLGWFL